MQDLPLHDIHLPAAVSWWPPAIGWWLLPLFLCVLVFAAYKLYKFIKQQKARANYKKLALKELQSLAEKFDQQENSIELLRAVSVLLRRIALSYLPRETVAGLTGEQWISQLNELSKPVTASDKAVNETSVNIAAVDKETTNDVLFSSALTHLLTREIYHEKVHYSQAELLATCEQWIKQLPAQTSRQVLN